MYSVKHPIAIPRYTIRYELKVNSWIPRYPKILEETVEQASIPF